MTPHTGLTSGTCAPYPQPPSSAWNVTYYSGTNASTAAALAAAADIVIASVATTSSEGSDRTNLSLPAWQDAMVSAVAAVQPKTVVLARCPGACFMVWKNAVPAILYSLLPGQEAGNAIANVIFGAVNPSGKLPVSFPAVMNDTWLGNPVNPAQYPGTIRNNSWIEADYSCVGWDWLLLHTSPPPPPPHSPTHTNHCREDIFIGYRWYDQQNITPLWPFGHGLSYTTWTYSNLVVANLTFTATLVNSGGVAGAEVAQLYIGYPAAAQEPPKQLKGFQKVALPAGGSTTLTFSLSPADLLIWNTTADAWALVSGTYTAMVGSSSRDIRLTASFAV